MSEKVITKIQDSQTNLDARCALGVAQHSSTAHLCNPSGACFTGQGVYSEDD